MSLGSSPHAPKDIISYLSNFDDGTLVSLYVDEFTSLTVFRSLRSLAKQYVMNLVLCPVAIPTATIAQWPSPEAVAHHKAAMFKLLKLKLIEKVDNGRKLQLNANFRSCLLKVIMGGSSKDMMYVGTADRKNIERPPSAERVEHHAKLRWETILNILVGIGDNKNIGDNLQNRATSQLLVQVGLIRNTTDRGLQITAEGFKFLFQDIHSQIWQIIIAYLQGVEQRKLSKKQVLMFLFKLSFLTLNKPYSTANFNDDQKCVVQDLCGMGLLYLRKSSSILFYPTSLAKHLSTGQSLTKQEREAKGFIIVETTFKIYAYTSSPLQIKLLSKFIRLDYRLPNLMTGKITKSSVMSAVSRGIPVDLIIEYLEQYAHKLMKAQEPILPINVVDQMRLWEAENQRMRIEPAFMICLIPTDQEFDEFIRIVTGRENDERATLLADNGAPDEMQQIIQRMDTFVNDNNKIQNNNEDENKVLDQLLDKTLPPLIRSLLGKMEENSQHTVKSRYEMIMTKYGWHLKLEAFTKKVNVNEIMKFSDELCAVHLSALDMANSSSKLLWSNKAEKTMVCTPKGREVLKRHRSQRRAALMAAKSAANAPSNSNAAKHAPPSLPSTAPQAPPGAPPSAPLGAPPGAPPTLPR